MTATIRRGIASNVASMTDLRLAVRSLLKTPSFTIVTLLTLGVGLGVTIAIFTAVHAVLLRPLPVVQPDRLLFLREMKLPQFPSFSVAPGHFVTWQRDARTFAAMAALQTNSLTLSGLGDPERVRGDRLTASGFAMLGTPAIRGRYFTDEEDRPGAAHVAVLSERFWRRRFAGDDGVIGRSLTLTGQPYTVIGVAPDGLDPILGDVDLWVPMAFDEAERTRHGSHYLRVIGRLRDGVTLAEARADLDRVAAALEADNADSRGWRLLVYPLHDYLVRNVRDALWLLAAAAFFVLAVVCSNVAALLVARGLARQKEMAVRAALGAERSRLVRALMTESLLLSVCALGIGLFVAYATLTAMLTLAPTSVPRSREIGLDGAALLFAAGLTIVTPLLFGLIPAWQVARTDLRYVLASGGRQVGQTLRRRSRGALVVGQMAMALILLVGCGLLVRSFTRLMQVDPGFVPDHTLVAALALRSDRFTTPEVRLDAQTRILDAVDHLPGVSAVGMTQSLPLVSDQVASFQIEGQLVDLSERPSTNFYAISPGYFDAMGMRLLRGRGIEARDRADAPRVVVINEAVARKYFADRDPIGLRLQISQGASDWREIIGIVNDTKQYGLAAETSNQVYESLWQQPFGTVEIVARSTADPALLTSSLRAIVRAIDPDQPLGRVTTLEELFEQSIGPQRFSLALFGSFALVALALAAVGLYGLISYTVSQQTQEIGIRFALGASRGAVSRGVLREALGLGLAGLVLGTALALVLTSLMRSLLFETSVRDVMTFVVTPLVLLTVVVLASLIPARRASRVDPIVAMRGE